MSEEAEVEVEKQEYTESVRLNARKYLLSKMLTEYDIDKYEHELVVRHMNGLTYG